MTHRYLLAFALALPAAAWAAPADLIRGLPPGGSWNQEVRKVVGAMYDTNGNGLLDTDAEIDGVDCAIWKAVDEGVRRDWRGSTVLSVYGFTPGAFWSGGELGIAEPERDHARAAMERCGIQPGEAAAQPGGSVVPGGAITGEGAGRDIAADIQAVSPKDTSAWGDAVGKLMLDAYDANSSGAIETLAELGAVPCGTWKALDAGTTAGWDGTGVRVIYGFDADFIWVGDVFHIDEALRTASVIAAATCGVGAPLADPSGPITGLPEGGMDGWDVFVRRAIGQAYDGDRSGMIDRESELASISCDTWSALDAGVQTGWGSGIRQIYGLSPDLTWVGNALGIDESLRAQADERAAACGLPGPGEASPAASFTPGSGTAGVVDAIRFAGSRDDFDGAVMPVLLAEYDLDGSGSINSGKEVKKVPCAVWGALDAAVIEDWGNGIRTIYGFEKDKIWVGYALGFDEKMRKKADAAAKRCLQ